MSGSDHRFETTCRYIDSGQMHAAIDLLAELLSEQPNEAIYHGLLASCLLAQKRFVAAEHENKIALGLDPTLPFLYQVRARILMLNRSQDEAIEACEESLRLDPESADPHLLKASIYVLQEKLDAAKSSLDRAAALDPGRVEVAVAYGDYYNGIGEYEKALGYAKQALKLNAASGIANILMGETQLALGNTAEAEYHAKFAISRDPDSTEALQLFANIRMRKSWYIGAWWLFNTWLATLGNLKSAQVLIGGFLSFNLLAVIAEDLGYQATSSFLSYAWLILVLYSWIGIPMYHWVMAREMEEFSFNPKF